jgi:hypothetical protein
VSDQHYENQAATFMVHSSHEEVANAVDTIMTLINGGGTDQGLDKLCYKKSIKKVTAEVQ